MITELKITIITEQNADLAEKQIREAISKTAYDISEIVVEEL